MIFSSFHFRLYYQKCREVKLCFYSVSQAYRLFFLPKNLPAAASIAANPKVVHPTGVSLSPVATAFSSLADGVPFVDGVSSGDSELSGNICITGIRICREFRICRWIRLRFFQTFYRFLQFFQCLIHIFFYCIFSKL